MSYAVQQVDGRLAGARLGRPHLRPLVQLELRTSTGQVYGLAVYAEAGATPGFDTQYDASKLANSTGLNLASLVGTTPLAIQGLPTLAGATEVVLPLRPNR